MRRWDATIVYGLLVAALALAWAVAWYWWDRYLEGR